MPFRRDQDTPLEALGRWFLYAVVAVLVVLVILKFVGCDPPNPIFLPAPGG